MKLKKCPNPQHKEVIYTLKETCPVCKEKTKETHYKFIKLKQEKEPELFK